LVDDIRLEPLGFKVSTDLGDRAVAVDRIARVAGPIVYVAGRIVYAAGRVVYAL
jgi:hypothetical protein